MKNSLKLVLWIVVLPLTWLGMIERASDKRLLAGVVALVVWGYYEFTKAGEQRGSDSSESGVVGGARFWIEIGLVVVVAMVLIIWIG